MAIAPSPPLDETITPGQSGHISDHDAIHIALNKFDGITANTESATFGPWYTFGNAPGSMGFAGTGTPAEAWAPFVVYNKFGDYVGLSNADIEHTTQAGAVIASYWGPTVDDSAEAFSFGVFLKDTGTPFTQSLALTGGEAIAQVEGGNHHAGSFTYPMVGMGSRTNVLDTAIVDHAEGFRASTTVDAGATLTEYVAFSQPAAADATTAFGVRVIDPIVTETSIVVDENGGAGLFQTDIAGSGGSAPAFVYVLPPASPDLIALKLQQAAGSVQDIFQAWLTGGTVPIFSISRLGFVTSRVAVSVSDVAGNGLVRIGQSGLEYLSTSLQQTTVGAAGAASALPGAPLGYFKAKNQAGTVVVIPYWAAA